MKRLVITIFTVSLLFGSSSFAGSTGSEELKSSSKEGTEECFEGFSRGMFSFNQGLDKIFFKPIAIGYRALPLFLRNGTGNMVHNISNLLTIPNNILQGNFLEAGNTTVRLAVNTTIGILGFFDPAEKMGYSRKGKEDYGQTFGVWGVDTGCYFVMPVLGPTTFRDFVGTVGDIWGDPWYNMTIANSTLVGNSTFKDSDYYISRGTSTVDFRAKNIESFDSLEENSMDFYASVKSLYLQDRSKKISNSSTIIETQDDSDWDEIDIN